MGGCGFLGKCNRLNLVQNAKALTGTSPLKNRERVRRKRKGREMKRKKQIEARLRACLAKYRWELWSEELSYDNQFPDCYEIPQKVEDEAMAKCPDGKPIPYNYGHYCAYEMAWVLGVDIDKKIDKFHDEIQQYLEKPKVKKAFAAWREENH